MKSNLLCHYVVVFLLSQCLNYFLLFCILFVPYDLHLLCIIILFAILNKSNNSAYMSDQNNEIMTLV